MRGTPKDKHYGQHLTNDTEAKLYIHNQPNDPICEKCLNFMSAWSNAGARNAVWKLVCEDLTKRAGQAFARGDDERAYSYRALGQIYEKEHWGDATKKLRSYIEQAGGASNA